VGISLALGIGVAAKSGPAKAAISKSDLLFDIFQEAHATHVRAIYAAVHIHAHAFHPKHCGRVGIRILIGNHRDDLAVLSAADPDTALEAGISRCVRFRIDHIHRVVFRDHNPAGTAPLFPFRDVLSILIEDLNAVVVAVVDEDAALGIHCDGVRYIEFSGAGAFLSPFLDEGAVLRELNDASVGISTVPVGHEDVAIGSYQNRGRSVEGVGRGSGDTGFPQSHQDFALRSELENLVAFPVFDPAVAYPDVAIAVDEEAVGLYKHAGSPAGQELSGRVEFEHRRIAAMEDPHIVMRIDLDGNYLAKLNSVWQLRPIHYLFVGIRLGIQG